MADWFQCDYCGTLTNLDQTPQPGIRWVISWLPSHELTTAALARAGQAGVADEPHYKVILAAYCGPACADEATHAERAWGT
jgi:hypothetical protein